MLNKTTIKNFLMSICLIFLIIIFSSCANEKNLLNNGIYEVSENDTVVELWNFYKNSNEGLIVDVVEGVGAAFEYEKVEEEESDEIKEYEEYLFSIGSDEDKKTTLVKKDGNNYNIKFQDGSEKYLKLIDRNTNKIDDYVNKYFK